MIVTFMRKHIHGYIFSYSIKLFVLGKCSTYICIIKGNCYLGVNMKTVLSQSLYAEIFCNFVDFHFISLAQDLKIYV